MFAVEDGSVIRAYVMDANCAREGAPSPEPAIPNIPATNEPVMLRTSPVSPFFPFTDDTYLPSDGTLSKSSPRAGSPKCLPLTGSTIAELLKLEGLKLQDILALEVSGEWTEVIQKGTEWWKIVNETVGDKDSWRLVHPPQAVKMAIVHYRLAQKDKKGKARDVDATVSAKTEDIVDRIGDPGYKDWVTKVLKPRVKGSKLLERELQRKNNDKGQFWWMSDQWGEEYRNDKDLARVVLNQVQAVNDHPHRHTWTADKKSVKVGRIEFKLKDFDVGSQVKLGIPARQVCQTCGNTRRCQACISCPECSFCKAAGACSLCECCQFTCCCRFPENPPRPGAVFCRSCGSCGICNCCMGKCCCARRLDPRFPDVAPHVGCERCRGERERERADGMWSLGKYWGSATAMAGTGVMVCEPPRAILPKFQPGNGVKKEMAWKKLSGAGHVSAAEEDVSAAFGKPIGLLKKTPGPSKKKTPGPSTPIGTEKKTPSPSSKPTGIEKKAYDHSRRSPSLDTITLDQLERELADKERELAELIVKRRNGSAQESPQQPTTQAVHSYVLGDDVVKPFKRLWRPSSRRGRSTRRPRARVPPVG